VTAGAAGLQAEAVSQLVNARTAAAADAALAGLSGGLGSCVASVRAAVIDALVSTVPYASHVECTRGFLRCCQLRCCQVLACRAASLWEATPWTLKTRASYAGGA
jgi:hypothetical protein